MSYMPYNTATFGMVLAYLFNFISLDKNQVPQKLKP